MHLSIVFHLFITVDLFNMRVVILGNNIHSWWNMLVVTVYLKLVIGGKLHSGIWFKCGIGICFLCLGIERTRRLFVEECSCMCISYMFSLAWSSYSLGPKRDGSKVDSNDCSLLISSLRHPLVSWILEFGRVVSSVLVCGGNFVLCGPGLTFLWRIC